MQYKFHAHKSLQNSFRQGYLAYEFQRTITISFRFTLRQSFRKVRKKENTLKRKVYPFSKAFYQINFKKSKLFPKGHHTWEHMITSPIPVVTKTLWSVPKVHKV